MTSAAQYNTSPADEQTTEMSNYKVLRYDTIEEINVDSKAEYTA